MMTDTYELRKKFIGPALEKFRRGDALSNEELNRLRQFYGGLETNLRLLGDQFFLAWKEARMRLMVLEEFHRARKRTRA